MKRTILYRSLLLLAIWTPIAFWTFQYALKEKDASRLDSLILSNGSVSLVQQEHWFDRTKGLQPKDHILEIAGQSFERMKVKEWLRTVKTPADFPALVLRNGKEVKTFVHTSKYTKSSQLILFFFPLFLSLIFLGFALGVPLQLAMMRKAREAVEVFSLFCFVVSIYFLTFLPTFTLGAAYSFSIVIPLLGMMLVHLFTVYPKKKCADWLRSSLLASGYLVALGVAGARIWFWNARTPTWIHELNIPILGVCLLGSLTTLGNTLLTSKDFWARRRARLLSLVFFGSFIAVLCVFVAFVWEVPRISIERILGVSLFFPTAFAVVFLKDDVFDLERMFRRGLHQLLLLGLAITFAVLIGVGWSQSRVGPQDDWILWVAIAIVVVVVARPFGNWFESAVHRLIQTRVKYPNVSELLDAHPNLDSFLQTFSANCESNLNMKSLSFRFFLDPTVPWGPSNEQRWQYKEGQIFRIYEEEIKQQYGTKLMRGDIVVGEIGFNGGDALAFDPSTSRDWEKNTRSLASAIEFLCLREFIAIQQSFLAVGRMQSLLAHEMKNPLAIIKVCAGLLNSHLEGNEEAEELLRTIQNEVRRVATAIQTVFDNSGRAEAKEKVNFSEILKQVCESALNRFPDRKLETSLWIDNVKEKEIGDFWLYVDKEGLRQSLNNLVINAFEVGSQEVDIELRLQARSFSIQVRDTGPGLPENIELFKPFVTTKANGTGLGLAHVKAFMDRNGGHIRVRSRPNEGTSFILEFSRQFVMNEA